MATTINISDLTNGSEIDGKWQGTGVFDTLINAVNGNIDLQYKQGRITTTEYANVYLGSMQSVISQSLDFLLKHELIVTQIDGEKANNAIKAVQLEEEQYKLNTLLPDEHNLNLKKELEIDKDLDIKERTTILQETKLNDELLTTSKERDKLDKEIKLITDQDSELLANGLKDRNLKDVQINEEQYKLDTLLPDEHNLNLKKELEIDKDLDIKNEQLIEEQYKVNTLLPDEHNKSVEQLKEIKASAILKDKEAVKAGLDKLTKIISDNPEDIYTLKYGI